MSHFKSKNNNILKTKNISCFNSQVSFIYNEAGSKGKLDKNVVYIVLVIRPITVYYNPSTLG